MHPDLGIGGAERLVVDAALALKQKGHMVHIVTAHHDKGHCFVETKNGDVEVTSVGDWLPRSLFGKCFAMFAALRMVYASIYLCWFSGLKPHVIFCDQVSAAIPILRFLSRSSRIIFYCHFPDQLLTRRDTVLKKVYRIPLDWLEEVSTGMADVILVNSKFTGGVFRQTFKTLAHRSPEVLYPSLNTDQFDKFSSEEEKPDGKQKRGSKFTFLSINRYERKKNLKLAIESLGVLHTKYGIKHAQLVMAGGYDNRVVENVQHFQELCDLAKTQGLEKHVEFLKSPSDQEKVRLLKHSDALLYTPSGEHFGIVPIEAMYNKLPVVAVNDGGPTETVVSGKTGYLKNPDPEDFAEAMHELYQGGSKLKQKLGIFGKVRVQQNFSFQAFGNKLDHLVTNTTC